MGKASKYGAEEVISLRAQVTALMLLIIYLTVIRFFVFMFFIRSL